MSTRTETIAVGGVPVAVTGDRRGRTVVRTRFGERRTTASPLVDLVASDGVLRPPDRAPDERGAADADLWWDDETVWWSWQGVTARACGSAAEVRWSDRATDDAIDLLCQYAVAYASVSRRRAVLHAAAIGRADEAVLVVGSSGAGKSTASAAALLGGWDLLADDLVTVQIDDDRAAVEGVQRPPLLPSDVVADAADALGAVAVDDDRGRVAASVGVLVPGPRRVRAVVSVGHDPDDGSVTVVPPAERVAAVLQGLALPPVPPVVRRHLPVLTALAGRPVLALDHASDPRRRRSRAQDLLATIWDRTG